ncbi:MAG: RloB family protein [Candidatus Marinimicrobia bacterium]|nr:RloB family protein [Candidatus Neomarinimicrobiota bacterium]
MGSDDLFKKGKLRARMVLQRKKELRCGRENILIVCEGETEKIYFEAFPLKMANLTIIGTGSNTKTLIKRAKRESEDSIKRDESYDQIWCVFDRDSLSKEQFNTAIQMAESRGFQVAWSNEAFELWYVLHFEYLNAGITRDQYCQKLDTLIGRKYEKTYPYMYIEMLPRQNTAIQNAEKLLRTYHDNTQPADFNPSTKVYLLVQELNKYL